LRVEVEGLRFRIQALSFGIYVVRCKVLRGTPSHHPSAVSARRHQRPSGNRRARHAAHPEHDPRVPRQLEQLHTSVRVPHADRAVGPAAHEGAAVLEEPNAVHLALRVPQERLLDFAARVRHYFDRTARRADPAFGFGVWGLGFEVWELGLGVWSLRFGVWGVGFVVWGFGVWGLGFGVWGLGFEVLGLGFGV